MRVRALLFDGTPRFEPAAPDPSPSAAEAVVRPVRALIGSPDLAVLRGRVNFRGVLGHRFVGVVEPGPEGARKWEGKRVVGSIHAVCGKCERCRAGLSMHCPTRTVLGLHGRDGCFADRFTLPVANLVEVPKNVSDDAAVFAEPLAAALHAAEVVRLEGKPFVTVLGDGVSGLLAAQVMTRRNASVRLLGLSPDKFTRCERWGIKHRHADEAGRRHDQDVVIDATNSPRGLELAMKFVRPRGTIVMLTAPAPVPTEAITPSTEPGPDLSPTVCNELNLVGARCGRLVDAIQTLARGEVDTLALITRRFRFQDGVAGLRAAGEASEVAVVLDF